MFKVKYLFLCLLFLPVTLLAQTLPSIPTKVNLNRDNSKKTNNHTNINSNEGGKSKIPSTEVVKKKFQFKIICDTDADLLVDGKKIISVKANEIYQIPFDRGVYDIKIVSLKTPEFEMLQSYKVLNTEDQDIWRVGLKQKEKGYINKSLEDIIKRFAIENYTETNSLYSWKINTSLKLIDSTLIISSRMKRFHPNGNLDGDDTKTTEIALSKLKCLKILKPSSEGILYNDSILMLELVGMGNYYSYDNIQNEKGKVRDLTSCSIPIYGRSKDECEIKINEYMHRNGISNQKIITCTPEEVSKKINPCLSDFKYSNHDYYISSVSIREPDIIQLLKEYKKYDGNRVLQSSDYKERLELSLNQMWEFSIYKRDLLSEEYEEYNHTELVFFGDTKVQQINSKGNINEFPATKLTLRIKDGCRVELEKFLNSCIKSK